MHKRPAKSLDHVVRRVRSFLSEPEQAEVTQLLEKLAKHSELAVFGGFLRDIALAGRKGFRSDFDVVMKTSQTTTIDGLLPNGSWSRNKFGGYRIVLERWQVDLWEFSETWAFKQGHVSGATWQDLGSTTFFNWDAIVLELASWKLHASNDYLRLLNSSILDINLRPNPNPLGMVVRALRAVSSGRVKLAPRLASYVATALRDYSDDAVIEAERTGFTSLALGSGGLSYLRPHLMNHLRSIPLTPFPEGSKLGQRTEPQNQLSLNF